MKVELKVVNLHDKQEINAFSVRISVKIRKINEESFVKFYNSFTEIQWDLD